MVTGWYVPLVICETRGHYRKWLGGQGSSKDSSPSFFVKINNFDSVQTTILEWTITRLRFRFRLIDPEWRTDKDNRHRNFLLTIPGHWNSDRTPLKILVWSKWKRSALLAGKINQFRCFFYFKFYSLYKDILVSLIIFSAFTRFPLHSL